MSVIEEAHQQLDTIYELLDKLHDLTLPDYEKGRVKWPIDPNDGKPELSIHDAYQTLYAIADSELELTFYKSNGNDVGDIPYVSALNVVGCGGPAYFWHIPLKTMIKKHYNDYDEEGKKVSPRAQLLGRLLKAFDGK